MTDGNTASALASRSETVPEGTPTVLASLVARIARAPAVWLAFVVGASVVVRGAIAINVPSPWILPDEVVYSEVAKSIAGGGFPSVRGVHELGWGVVYQALIAPAWVVFADPMRAYHAALAVNALMMSLAAIPAYFLARMFVGRNASVLVAAMTVLVPSTAYTGVLMTENACYPAFLLSVLLMTRAVRSPSSINQALALVGLGIVALTRIQGAALVGAYLVAVFLYAWVGPRPQRGPYLRRFIPTVVVSLLASLTPIAASVARGNGPTGWLGSRSGTFDEVHVHEVPQWFVFLVSDLVLYVAVVPAAATAVMLGRGLSSRASAQARLFAAVALPTLAAMLLSVAFVSASLDVDGTENLNERYVFYVVPLLFVGLALWLAEDLPRRRPWSFLVVAGCCLLAVVLPVDRLEYNAGFQSVALLPWIDFSVSPTVLAVLMGGFALACGALWLTCRPDRSGRLWLVVAVWMAFVGVLTVGSNATSARNSASAFAGQAAWVDDTVRHGQVVPVLWDETLAPTNRPEPFSFWLMVTELFNEDVGTVYRIGPPTYYETFLPTVPVRLGPNGSIVDRHGRRLETRYVLVSCKTPVEGTVVAQAPRGALRLVEVDGPLRLSDVRPCERTTP